MQFSLAALVAVAAAQSIVSCDANAIFSPAATTLSPSPVVIGGDVTVTSAGALAAPINPGATYKVVLKLGPVTVFTETHDFCAGSKVPCPIAATPEALISVSQAVPANAPAGNFNMQITVTNADGSAVSCLSGPVRLVKSA
jgi:hypothetical protein